MIRKPRAKQISRRIRNRPISNVEINRNVCEERNLEASSSFWLLHLPSEILLYILKLLSSRDLLSLIRIGDKRIVELSYAIKKANFQSLPNVFYQDIYEFFSRNRLKCIVEINFNYLCSTKPSELVNVIKKCKNLKSLSVVECGVEFVHLIRIFQNCEKLEELSWSLFNPRIKNIFPCNCGNISVKNLKKVSLFLPYIDEEIISVLACLSCICGSLKSIYLNCSNEFAVLPCPGRMNLFCMPSPIIGQVLIVSNHCSFSNCVNKANQLFRKLILAYDFPDDLVGGLSKSCKIQRDPTFEIKDYVSLMFIEPAYVQLTSKLDHISKLVSIPANSVHTLVFILSEDIKELSEEVIQTLIHIGGKKLKNLCLQDVSADENPTSYESKSTFICHGIQKILVACDNITVLNIADFHFEIPFPYEALSNAKYLENLTLPSCAVQDLVLSKTDLPPAAKENLVSLIVFNSKKVKHFTMFGCLSCEKGPSDDDMVALKEWPNLQHLSLLKVSSFRTCHFLQAVTDFCKDLKTLELVQVGHPEVCHYIKNVTYVLQKAQHFSFLRLNQKAFYPMDTYFWRCISLAKTLKGLCIMTESEVVMKNSVVCNAIAELRHLSLFHYVSRRYGMVNLHRDVMFAMSRNGVENPRVEIKSLPFDRRISPLCNSLFPGCCYLHFQNF